MMNLYLYWLAGAFKSIPGKPLFLVNFPRPAGALYYLPLYHFFSLNPLPYRIVQVSILAATIPIFFWLARLLSGSGAVAFLVALAMCYHGQMARLVFYRLFHLRRAVWFFLFRGADLLRSCSRERPDASSGPTGDFSHALRLRAELKGNGSELAADCVYLRSSHMSTAGRLERFRAPELVYGDSGVRRCARDGNLHLREIKWPLFAGASPGVSTGLLLASIHDNECAFHQ